MLAWPMYVESAFALTPAAMQVEAKVWRASWSVIRASPAAFQTAFARLPIVKGVKARRRRERTRARPARPLAPAHPVLDEGVAQGGRDRDGAAGRNGLGVDRALYVVPPRSTRIMPAARSRSSQRSPRSSPRRRPAYIAVAQRRGRRQAAHRSARRLLRRGDPVALAVRGGHFQLRRRVVGDDLADDRPPEDHPERVERVPDRRGPEPSPAIASTNR